MASFFKRFSFSPFAKPTPIHRKMEKGSVAAQLVTTSLKNFSPPVAITVKFSQVLMSGYTFARTDTTKCEQALHFIQICTAAAEVGLSIYLMYQDDMCGEFAKNTICTTALICECLYNGTLLIGWGSSEPFFSGGQDVPVDQFPGDRQEAPVSGDGPGPSASSPGMNV